MTALHSLRVNLFAMILLVTWKTDPESLFSSSLQETSKLIFSPIYLKESEGFFHSMTLLSKDGFHSGSEFSIVVYVLFEGLSLSSCIWKSLKRFHVLSEFFFRNLQRLQYHLHIPEIATYVAFMPSLSMSCKTSKAIIYRIGDNGLPWGTLLVILN